MDNEIKPQSNQGGKRPNAGRKPGTGKFNEPTTAVRVPTSQTAIIKDFLSAYQRKKLVPDISQAFEIMVPDNDAPLLELPLFTNSVSAGFPSPAEGHIEKRLDLNKYLIKDPNATYYIRVGGISMTPEINPGDVIAVNRAKNARIGAVVVACVNGNFTLKRLHVGKDQRPLLVPANPEEKSIEVTEDMDFFIWGVVVGVVRKM